MDDQRVRPSVAIGVGAFLTALAVVVLVLESARRPGPSSTRDPVAATEPGALEASQPPAPATSTRRERSAARTAEAPAEQDPVPFLEGLVFGDIDLREAREAMPDNLYWELGTPTKDPAELARRDEEKRRRNEEHGRVLSGDASEEEVRAYWEYRRRMASDFVEFAEFLKRRYRDRMPEEMSGVLDLALKLNAERLAQIPADLESSLEHARTRAQVREDWRRQQEEFGDVPVGDDAGSP